MRFLILSDIHSNFEALQAVLTAVQGEYDAIACLGDIVGYGPDPNAVTDWIRQSKVTCMRGNHEIKLSFSRGRSMAALEILPGEKYRLNPGSVGQSRDGTRVRLLPFTTAVDGAWNIGGSHTTWRPRKHECVSADCRCLSLRGWGLAAEELP